MKLSNALTLVVVAWLSIFIADQAISYSKSPPLFKAIKLASFKHPFQTSIHTDDVLKDFFSTDPTKTSVLKTLEDADFKIALDPKQSNPPSREVYYSIGQIPTGFIGSLLMMGQEVSINVVFVNDSLSDIQSKVNVSGP